ncbi:hypothetical protein M422DRAFT_253787 [Sphaerobolus stellatus SS14]|uniref:Nephrocystin 3-like N-terminal domain-containing protein n=1 Tax=Sphaerobolus stellatus (strain SS14) TaxID=990650 RepID=A0A0C9UIY2_SPHS4|nr:hypothetical protein M422DRAFT_253787 [Sphaerobolus stellatus SS14]
MINAWKLVWSKFDTLIKLSEKIPEIHPYAKIAASALLSAYNIWKAQNTRDQDMFELLKTIYELCNFVRDAAPTEIIPAQKSILKKIMEQVIDCSQFISGYCNNHSFALKAVKHIFTGVDDAIIKYNASFESLKLAFTQRATLSTQDIIEDHSLHKTDDISDQFVEFICKTVSECSILGLILLVIDALDECGGQAWNDSLKLLSDQELMKKIPPNFRIFITSCPDHDVKIIFNHVHILQLHEHDREETDQDILTFVHCALITNPPLTLNGINEDHCLKVTQKSEGLFQWASMACQIVQEAAEEGQVSMYALEQVLSSGSGLYSMYKTAHNTRFKSIKDPIFKKQFKTVLGLFSLFINHFQGQL